MSSEPYKQLSIRSFAIPPASRALLVGGTGTGKSTLASYLMRQWLARSNRRLIIIDSKPRFKAEKLPGGLSAKPRYRGWTLGEEIAGSVSITSEREWEAARRARIRIVQNRIDEPPDRSFLAWAAVEAFRAAPKEKDPLLVYVDEAMDHFRSSSPVSREHGWIWEALARNGRELNIAAMFATQRPKRISLSLLDEVDFLFCFALRDTLDRKRLYEVGLPRDFIFPAQKHVFTYWRASEPTRCYGPYQLALESSQ
jgi:DNA helicase HerA-like ATPase